VILRAPFFHIFHLIIFFFEKVIFELVLIFYRLIKNQRNSCGRLIFSVEIVNMFLAEFCFRAMSCNVLYPA